MRASGVKHRAAAPRCALSARCAARAGAPARSKEKCEISKALQTLGVAKTMAKSEKLKSAK